jgi:hypothetical protein
VIEMVDGSHYDLGWAAHSEIPGGRSPIQSFYNYLKRLEFHKTTVGDHFFICEVP